MGWSGKLEDGDKVRVTVDFEDVISNSYDDEVELARSSWTISADDPRVTVEKLKPRLPVSTGSVIDIEGGERAMLTVNGYWQFSNGSVYTASQVHSLFNFEVALEG